MAYVIDTNVLLSGNVEDILKHGMKEVLNGAIVATN